MKFQPALQEAVFLKRYKRFFADIQLHQGASSEIVVAHVANTGSMKGLLTPGAKCLVSPSSNPERKLKWTLEALQDLQTGSWVGVNTSWPNKLVHEAFTEGKIKAWKQWDQIQGEVKINSETRLDFVFSDSKTGKKHFVEVKNVTLAEDGVAMFPDAVTERGQKHLRELMKLVREGHSAEIVFTVQRTDCKSFRAAHEIDPEYADLLSKATKAGVSVQALVVQVDSHGARITSHTLPVF